MLVASPIVGPFSTIGHPVGPVFGDYIHVSNSKATGHKTDGLPLPCMSFGADFLRIVAGAQQKSTALNYQALRNGEGC
jgi:hypothetical protein